LVQFEIVHVAACANFWCVHDEKHVIRIHMDPWNVVAILAFGDRHGVEVKLLGQDHLGSIAPLGNVEPKESITTFS
jgi:hypothetical protein